MVTISEVSYRKSIIENSDNEMDVDMELNLDDESTVVVKSTKAARPLKSPKAARKTMPKIVVTKKTVPKKKDGVKKDAMKTKAKPKPKAVESSSKCMNTAEMVFQALASLKSRKGITMQSIRNYILKNFGVQGKQRNNLIKEALKELFQTGEVGNLEPSQDGDLKFNNRFWFAPQN